MRTAKSIDLPAMRRAIRAECTQQGIDDDARRDMMQALAGVASSTELDARGATKVLDHLRRTSGKKSAPAARQPHEWDWANRAPADRRNKIWKIRRLCIEAGIAEGKQMAYAEGIALQMSGAASSAGPVAKPLPMCDAAELQRIVQALTVSARRHGKNPNDAHADASAHA